MGKLSGKQLSAIVVFLGFLLLFLLGISETGQRLAMAAAQPFAAASQFLQQQVSTLCADDEDLQRQIHDLELQVRSLEQQVRDTVVLRRENQQLRETLALGQFPGWHVLRAEVMTRDPATWDLHFTINRGRAEGVVPGAPVLFEKWLIGRVATVHRHSSVVHTLISPQCRLGVKLAGTDYHGLLSGMGRMHAQAPGCTVRFLPLDAQAQPSDLLVTSGLGGTIPEGIPLGAVRPNARGQAIWEVEHARKELQASPLAPWHTFRIVSLLLPN